MFYQRYVISPALGKANEARSLMEEQAKIDQSRVRTVLTERVLGKGQRIIKGKFYENLEAFEKEMEFIRTDPSFLEFVGKMSALVESPWESQLYHVISAPTGSNPPGSYTHVVRFNAAHDKEAEMRATLEEFAKARESEGARPPSIMRRLFTPDGPTFLAISAYENLTEFENITVQRPPSIQEVIAKTSSLITGPTQHALFQILVSRS